MAHEADESDATELWRRLVRQREQFAYLATAFLVVLLGAAGVIWPLLAHLTTTTTNVFISIGCSLIATGVVLIAQFWYLHVSARRIDDLEQRLEKFENAGITAVYERRDLVGGGSLRGPDFYREKLRNAAEIDVLGFGLHAFRNDIREFIDQISTGSQIRILLLDPDHPSPAYSYAKARDVEENEDNGRIASDVRAFLREFAQRFRPEDGITVKLYQCLPSVNLMRVDDEIFFGPYLMDRSSGATLVHHVNNSGYLYRQIKQHFESIWKYHSVAPGEVLPK